MPTLARDLYAFMELAVYEVRLRVSNRPKMRFKIKINKFLSRQSSSISEA